MRRKAVTPPAIVATRRLVLKWSAAVAGFISIFFRNSTALAARKNLDVGLIAPGSGIDPHTLEKVGEAIKLDTDGTLFPEFKDRDVNLTALDSQNDDKQAVNNVQKLADIKVQWLVSGDVYPNITKAEEVKGKELGLEPIFAVSRMKLNKSNPHPYAFQILPPPDKFAEGTVENLTRRNIKKGQWWIVSPTPSEYSTALAAAAEKMGNKIQTVLIGQNSQDVSTMQAKLDSSRKQFGTPDGILIVGNRESLQNALAESYANIPIVFDTYLDDPANLIDHRWPSQAYFSTYFSRRMRLTPMLSRLIQNHQSIFKTPISPVTVYSAAAFQVIDRALANGDIGKVRIDASHSVSGFGITFDNQGYNTGAGRPKLLQLRNGELTDITP